MRFISIAAALFFAATALGEGVGCDKKCYPYMEDARKVCKEPTPVVVRNGAGCVRCCKGY